MGECYNHFASEFLDPGGGFFCEVPLQGYTSWLQFVNDMNRSFDIIQLLEFDESREELGFVCVGGFVELVNCFVQVQGCCSKVVFNFLIWEYGQPLC